MLEVLDDAGYRIDSYLAEKLDLSRSKVQRLIKNDKVLVNGKTVNSSYVVKSGDAVVVNDDTSYETSIVSEDIPIDIVYEDQDLLIINKKSGMVVHPAPGHYTGTLVNALLYKYDMSGLDSLRPGIVHRLDKDTSGLMIVAKNEESLEKLSEMISKKEVERKYLAIVDGVIKHDTGEIDAPIGRDINNRQKMSVTDINSKEAITYFKVLERFDNHTLIECTLKTGRTHQIRVHMAYIGFPVCNDPLYGRRKATEFGQMLHSYSIKFIHPKSGEELFYKIDVPSEFQEMLDELRKV